MRCERGERDALSPDTMVAREIRGAWPKTTMSIGKEFVDEGLEKVAQQGLEGWLDGLPCPRASRAASAA